MTPEAAAIIIQKYWRAYFTRLLLHRVVPFVAQVLEGHVDVPDLPTVSMTLFRVIMKFMATRHITYV